MTRFFELTKRNVRLFFRDKGAVFFALLSMFIVVILMVMFLGDLYEETIVGLLGELPMRDSSQDADNARLTVLCWTFAGIIPINAQMAALASLSSIIRDKTTGRINSLYTAPVSRMTITLSYISAACICSAVICTLTVACSEGYMVIKGLEPFTAGAHLKLFGMIIANAFAYSAIMYFCAALVGSEGAWSGVGTVFGTLAGFLGGIYMPVGSLSDGLKTAVNCTPMIYGTVMFRSVMTEEVLKKTFSGAPDQMLMIYRERMGIDHTAFGHSVSAGACVVTVLCFGAVFMAAGAAATAFMKKRDR